MGSIIQFPKGKKKIPMESNFHLKCFINEVVKGNFKLEQADVSKITDFRYIFVNFNFKLEYGTIENWDVSNGVYFDCMFSMSVFMNFDFSKWNMENAVHCDHMFEGCVFFQGTGLEKWRLPKLATANFMFANCHSLDFNVSNLGLSNLVEATAMFFDCISFKGNGFENIELPNLVYASQMFEGDYMLHFQNPNLKLLNLVYADRMFYDCHSFNSNVSGWNPKSLNRAESMFENCINFEGNGLENWKLFNIENKKNIFTNTKYEQRKKIL